MEERIAARPEMSASLARAVDWRDLREFDLKTSRERLLIHDARIGDLAFDRTRHALWGVRHLNGISAIVVLEPPYRNWRLVWALPYGSDVYDLDVAPDGRSLSASFAEISGRQTLRLFDAEAVAHGDTSTRVVHDFGSAIPSGFTWSPDGAALWGSSYYTGVSNIWRYDVAADSMDLMSNAETGFFEPIELGDGSLIVFRYTGAGFVPSIINVTPLEDVSAITFLGQQIVEKHPVLATWNVGSPASIPIESMITKKAPYQPLKRLRVESVYPVVAGYMQRYGQRAMEAGAQIDLLARLYWYTVEFGLIATRDGLRIYGSGILSSAGESVYCLEDPRPRRLRFDLRRIMRTRYRIDDFQQLYFVIDDFQELFDATRPDFAPIYREIATLPDLEPTTRVDQDREFVPWSRKKIGPRISAAQV